MRLFRFAAMGLLVTCALAASAAAQQRPRVVVYAGRGLPGRAAPAWMAKGARFQRQIGLNDPGLQHPGRFRQPWEFCEGCRFPRGRCITVSRDERDLAGCSLASMTAYPRRARSPIGTRAWQSGRQFWAARQRYGRCGDNGRGPGSAGGNVRHRRSGNDQGDGGGVTLYADVIIGGASRQVWREPSAISAACASTMPCRASASSPAVGNSAPMPISRATA